MLRTVRLSGAGAAFALLVAISPAFADGAALRPSVQVPTEVLAVAPPGSCAANPEAKGCPPVDRIVDIEERSPDGSTAFAPLSSGDLTARLHDALDGRLPLHKPSVSRVPSSRGTP